MVKEGINKKQMDEAKSFMETIIKETGISDATFRYKGYLDESRDGPTVCSFDYGLPTLNGFGVRGLDLSYLPAYLGEDEYGRIAYTNAIISSEKDIYKFLGSSDFLKSITPVVLSELRMIGGFPIPKKILRRWPQYEVREFSIVDHKFHTPRGSDKYHYCMAVSMFVTPKIFETQAKAIGSIEGAIREFVDGRFNSDKYESDLVCITIE